MTLDEIRNVVGLYSSMKLSTATLNKAKVTIEMPKQARDKLYREVKKDPTASPPVYPYPVLANNVTVMIAQSNSLKRSRLYIIFDVTGS